MHVVAAPDKFRGTATAREITAAVARGARTAGATCDEVPMADGGEGTLDALGGPNRVTTVIGPLGDPVEAPWRMADRTAVIEMARASGLLLAGGADGNDPMEASTYGTGELITAALEAGARRIIVGVGGSASTDGGLGALEALNAQRLRAVKLIVACDVRTTFVDAAEVFSPQKGARPSQVKLLRRRLERLAQQYREKYEVDVTTIAGSGAAGGLAGGLAAVGATLVPAFELIADEVSLPDRMEKAGLVITGEGFLDEESFDGKVVGGVADLARELDVRAVAIVGDVFDGVGSRIETISLVERYGRERAINETTACVEEAVAALISAKS